MIVRTSIDNMASVQIKTHIIIADPGGTEQQIKIKHSTNMTAFKLIANLHMKFPKTTSAAEHH